MIAERLIPPTRLIATSAGNTLPTFRPKLAARSAFSRCGRGFRLSLLAILASAAVACGGGGAGGVGGTGSSSGDSGSASVPTSATKTLTNSPEEARALAGAVIDGDANIANANQNFKRASNGGLGLVTQTASTTNNLASGAALKTMLETARVVTKGTTSIGCNDIYALGSTLDGPGDLVTNCTGSISFVTPDDLDQNAQTLPVGTVFTINYSNLSVTGSQSGLFSLSGQLTMRVTQALDISGTAITGSMRITGTSLSGIDGGESYGPENFTLDLDFGASGVSLVIDGERIANLQTDFTDENNFTLRSGSAMTEVDGAYVSVSFNNWQVVQGIPQAGSSLTLSGANGGQATLQVSAADANSATLNVSITTTDAGTRGYTVISNFTNGQASII